ncbi:MAG: hypothetical protein HY652_06380 [Acidobacteria bacterium]|nr:hypothetical protein [Acidobacteriota bacterium]
MVEDEVKQLQKKIIKAINEALSESSKLNVAIQNVRDAGCEVFLTIEATIGIHRNSDASGGAESDKEDRVRLHLTSQDAKFLKSLKIAVDEEVE